MQAVTRHLVVPPITLAEHDRRQAARTKVAEGDIEVLIPVQDAQDLLSVLTHEYDHLSPERRIELATRIELILRLGLHRKSHPTT